MEKSFRINLDEETQRRFKAAVAKTGGNMKAIVRAFIIEYTDKEEKKQENKTLNFPY